MSMLHWTGETADNADRRRSTHPSKKIAKHAKNAKRPSRS